MQKISSLPSLIKADLHNGIESNVGNMDALFFFYLSIILNNNEK